MKIIAIAVLVSTLGVQAGTLPGDFAYFFEKIGEWVEVNLLTLSTKHKQDKKLRLSSERIAELETLLLAEKPNRKAENEAVRRYQDFLAEGQDMAEKIVILDGAEIGLADKFEEISRRHEQILGSLFERADRESFGFIQEALTSSRLLNKDMFVFMVEKYQFTQADIQKHKDIVGRHIELVEERISDFEEQLKGKQEQQIRLISEFLTESREFQAAGLNVQAYEMTDRAKNILYSLLMQISLE